MKLSWYKTNRKEVFDFIVKYERFNYEQTKKEGVYPTSSIIANAFDISNQRAWQYLVMFKKRVNNLKK